MDKPTDETHHKDIGLLPVAQEHNSRVIPYHEYTMKEALACISNKSSINSLCYPFLESDPDHNQEFETEVLHFLQRGLPNSYLLANVLGDGNCLIYAVVTAIKSCQLQTETKWFDKKK